MGHNILMVDDSQTVRAVLKKTLELAHMDLDEIYEAGNGKEALKILDERKVDMVFTEITMPLLGGVEMVERMAEHGLLPAIPVVVVTAEGTTPRVKDLMAKGVAAHVRKPFRPETIRSVAGDILAARHG